jgi:hypothetical protein
MLQEKNLNTLKGQCHESFDSGVRLFFYAAKHIIDDFEGLFEGAKVEAPRKTSRIRGLCVCQHTKKTSETFRISGALVFLCTGATTCSEILVLSLIIVILSFLIRFKNYQ